MTQIQRVNVTPPEALINKSKMLIEEGLYSNFSELVRESIKNEILTDKELIEKKKHLTALFKK